jgi:hypothetical protein
VVALVSSLYIYRIYCCLLKLHGDMDALSLYWSILSSLLDHVNSVIRRRVEQSHKRRVCPHDDAVLNAFFAIHLEVRRRLKALDPSAHKNAC